MLTSGTTIFSLANQEVLRWILSMRDEIGDDAPHEKIKEYLWSTLKSGRVIPGCFSIHHFPLGSNSRLIIDYCMCRYGHGVLRDPDPRFTALQTFCEVRPELQDSAIIGLVKKTSEVAPGVLREHGKVMSFRCLKSGTVLLTVLRLDQESEPER